MSGIHTIQKEKMLNKRLRKIKEDAFVTTKKKIWNKKNGKSSYEHMCQRTNVSIYGQLWN